ncbi:MAG: hypothetical protein ACOYLB_14345 [Phototrophicaceae bacterium]
MSKFNLEKIGRLPRGLAVEGETDKKIIEAFLKAGEQEGHWADWRNQVGIQPLYGSNNILKALKPDSRIWGLIDRDWRTDEEVQALQNDYPQLLILPRKTIENYAIAPDELDAMLLPAKKIPDLAERLETHLDRWIRHGVLSQTLHVRHAHDFCRGDEGYPKALFNLPTIDEPAIEAQVQTWYAQLEPTSMLEAYRERLEQFRANPQQHYTHHIDGKLFFNEVILKMLNTALGQKDEKAWKEDLFTGLSRCPHDMIPILARVVTT